MAVVKTITTKSLVSVLIDLIGEEVNVRLAGDSGYTTSILTSVGLDYISLTCKGSKDPLIVATKHIVKITRFRGND